MEILLFRADCTAPVPALQVPLCHGSDHATPFSEALSGFPPHPKLLSWVSEAPPSLDSEHAAQGRLNQTSRCSSPGRALDSLLSASSRPCPSALRPPRPRLLWGALLTIQDCKCHLLYSLNLPAIKPYPSASTVYGLWLGVCELLEGRDYTLRPLHLPRWPALGLLLNWITGFD